jgi:hypothetical protein
MSRHQQERQFFVVGHLSAGSLICMCGSLGAHTNKIANPRTTGDGSNYDVLLICLANRLSNRRTAGSAVNQHAMEK